MFVALQHIGARSFLQACKVKEDTRLWKAIKCQRLPRRGHFPQTLRSNQIFRVFPKTRLLPRPLALTHPSLCLLLLFFPPCSSLGLSSAVSGNEMIAGGESLGEEPGAGHIKHQRGSDGERERSEDAAVC